MSTWWLASWVLSHLPAQLQKLLEAASDPSPVCKGLMTRPCLSPAPWERGWPSKQRHGGVGPASSVWGGVDWHGYGCSGLRLELAWRATTGA